MNWDCGLWLELQGRWVDSDAIAPEASIGPRILLPPGSFSNENEALGLVNINPVPLDDQLLASPWILYRYVLYPANDETGQRGDETIALDLSYGMLVDRPIYDAIPPGAIQPMSASQPLFTMNPSTMQRNPCPGYKERVYLYCTPGQPFQASAVLYTDISGSIASVELFDQKLRKLNSDYMRRCWVSLYR
jgi:hypothetical protein